ncbi:MAG: ABC-type transport auxiliary lipoprotein family protein [Syntrophorhabdaceae bacterium]|nr:ABC-type transport auxiliary lipoprotein family protein [Syntrophorhabdaceae bacterium]
MRQQIRRIPALLFLPLVCLALVAGCLGRTKPPFVMDQYTLEYPEPQPAGQPLLEELIRVERFSVAPAFNSTDMVIKTGQYRFDTYKYSRWRTNPSDMVSGFILRDVTRAGIFKGTYSYYDTDLSRYILDGHVDEFCESDEDSPGKAVLSVRITLVDTSLKNPVEQVVFQRQYTYSAEMNDRSPDGLAAALSAAMKDLSAKLVADIGLELKSRGGK